MAGQWRVSRQTLHAWLARYEAQGLEGLADRSHRPGSCPHQMPASVEAGCWSCAGRVRLGGRGGSGSSWPGRGRWAVPSESAIYRCLVRAGVIDPSARRRRKEKWKRWERSAPKELWQMDVVGGFLLADGIDGEGVDRGR